MGGPVSPPLCKKGMAHKWVRPYVALFRFLQYDAPRPAWSGPVWSSSFSLRIVIGSLKAEL